MISVIMSIYKEPLKWIEKSINSILTQSYSNLELIIVCDNPTNIDIKNLLFRHEALDGRIKLIFNEENIGLTKSLNKALDLAQGEFIARMDADDISKPQRLNVQIEFLHSHPDIDLCYTNFDIIDDQDIIVASNVQKGQNGGQEMLPFWNAIPHPTVMFRSKLLELRVPFYNEKYRTAQDYELWTYLTLNNITFDYINISLFSYRHSSQQVTQIRKNEQNNNFLSIRYNFIKSYIRKFVNIDEGDDAATILKKLKGINISHHTTNYSDTILYILYYTASKNNKSYICRYFLDSRLLFLRLNFRYSIYILLLLFNIYKGSRFKL